MNLQTLPSMATKEAPRYRCGHLPLIPEDVDHGRKSNSASDVAANSTDCTTNDGVARTIDYAMCPSCRRRKKRNDQLRKTRTLNASQKEDLFASQGGNGSGRARPGRGSTGRRDRRRPQRSRFASRNSTSGQTEPGQIEPLDGQKELPSFVSDATPQLHNAHTQDPNKDEVTQLHKPTASTAEHASGTQHLQVEQPMDFTSSQWSGPANFAQPLEPIPEASAAQALVVKPSQYSSQGQPCQAVAATLPLNLGPGPQFTYATLDGSQNTMYGMSSIVPGLVLPPVASYTVTITYQVPPSPGVLPWTPGFHGQPNTCATSTSVVAGQLNPQSQPFVPTTSMATDQGLPEDFLTAMAGDGTGYAGGGLITGESTFQSTMDFPAMDATDLAPASLSAPTIMLEQSDTSQQPRNQGSGSHVSQSDFVSQESATDLILNSGEAVLGAPDNGAQIAAYPFELGYHEDGNDQAPSQEFESANPNDNEKAAPVQGSDTDRSEDDLDQLLSLDSDSDESGADDNEVEEASPASEFAESDDSHDESPDEAMQQYDSSSDQESGISEDSPGSTLFGERNAADKNHGEADVVVTPGRVADDFWNQSTDTDLTFDCCQGAFDDGEGGGSQHLSDRECARLAFPTPEAMGDIFREDTAQGACAESS